MGFGRIMRIIIANIILLFTSLGSFALLLFIVFGIAALIKGLPDFLIDPILIFTILISFGLFFLLNYVIWKFTLRKFRVTEKDIISWDA